MIPDALIIFAKNPAAGKVKTRLAASIGNDAALAIYELLLEITRKVTEVIPVDKYVFYSDHIEPGDCWNEKYYSKAMQHGNDLGERMNNAFKHIFAQRYQRAVIIGTDCPGLTDVLIKEAFDRLEDHDVVIGPAEDGGYYLLGMKKPQPELFEKMNWSTPDVLKDTLSRCEKSGLKHSQLHVLSDVDVEKDLWLTKLKS